MMKKNWLTVLFTLFTVLVLVVGCGNNSNEPTQNSETNEEVNDAEEEVVFVTISKDEGEEVLSEKEIEIEENDILMEVMQENFEIEEEEGFITTIDGVGPEEGEEKAWMYFVNNEMAMVGAAEYELKAGDQVLFDLQAWE